MQAQEKFKATAQDIYSTPLMSSDPKPSGQYPTQGFLYQNLLSAKHGQYNIWRMAWAFDTLLDYFSIIDSSEATSLAQQMASSGLNAEGGDWWDDFGWSGIVSLRVAENLLFEDELQIDYFKAAINSWCFMYGNGWKIESNTTDPSKYFTVPFPDLPGWKTLIAKHGGDVGAPNVFAHAVKNNPHLNFWSPLFNGGTWNSTIDSGTNPRNQSSTPGTCTPSGSFLAPIQNTVTNALFALLTLRIYQATQKDRFKTILEEVQFDSSSVLKAWVNQMSWFHNWFYHSTDNTSMLYRLQTDYVAGQSIALIRERAPKYANGKWDASYCEGLAWTGDQGLMIGLLRESEQFLTSDVSNNVDKDVKTLLLKKVTPIYHDILAGVSKYVHSDETYYNESRQKSPLGGGVAFLRPWAQVVPLSASFIANYALFPQGDDADYCTGTGVFYRYLLQAYNSDPKLIDPYKKSIMDAANAICEQGFPVRDYWDTQGVSKPSLQLNCDGMLQTTSNNPERYNYNSMTASINRIALLTLAYKLSAASS